MSSVSQVLTLKCSGKNIFWKKGNNAVKGSGRVMVLVLFF